MLHIVLLKSMLHNTSTYLRIAAAKEFLICLKRSKKEYKRRSRF